MPKMLLITRFVQLTVKRYSKHCRGHFKCHVKEAENSDFLKT